MLPLKMTINRTIFNGFLMAFLMGAINGILMGLYAVVLVKYGLNLFCLLKFYKFKMVSQITIEQIPRI